MLNRAADTFIAGVELVEAEGRVLRDRASGFARGAVGLAAFALLGLAGALAVCVGVTMAVAQAMGTPAALCLVGGAVSLVGIGGWVWCASVMGAADSGETRAIERR